MKGIAALDQHAVSLYRLAHRLYVAGYFRLAMAVTALNKILTGVEIEPGAEIGPGFIIHHGVGLVIAEHASIGADCVIYQGVTVGVVEMVPDGYVIDPAAPLGPTIGDGVCLYAGAKVLGPISIGDGATVGANSVVLRDVPAGKVAVGVPARLLDSPA